MIPFNGKIHEAVFSILDNKNIWALRQSNQTFTLLKSAAKRCPLIDSDKAMLEDKYGHRYARCIHEETELNSKRWIYRMI